MTLQNLILDDHILSLEISSFLRSRALGTCRFNLGMAASNTSTSFSLGKCYRCDRPTKRIFQCHGSPSKRRQMTPVPRTSFAPWWKNASFSLRRVSAEMHIPSLSPPRKLMLCSVNGSFGGLGQWSCFLTRNCGLPRTATTNTLLVTLWTGTLARHDV